MVSNHLIFITPEERKGRPPVLFFLYFGFLNLKCVKFEQLPATQIRNPTYFSGRKEQKAHRKAKTSERSLSGEMLLPAWPEMMRLERVCFIFSLVSPGRCYVAISPVVQRRRRPSHAIYFFFSGAPSIPLLRRHCCNWITFRDSLRIGATCLAFLSLKDSTSSSTKSPIVPGRAWILQRKRERENEEWHDTRPRLASNGWSGEGRRNWPTDARYERAVRTRMQQDS